MKTTDKNNREIMVGDILKAFHFVGANRKKHYMYKQVIGIVNIKNNTYLKLSHLDLTDKYFLLRQDGKKYTAIEIIQGFDADGVSFEDR